MRLVNLFLGIFLLISVAQASDKCSGMFAKKSHPFRAQINDYFCGPAVVESIFNKYGYKMHQKEIAQRLQTESVFGTSPEAILRIFQVMKFKTEIKKISNQQELQKLLSTASSVIALVTFDGEAHWVVVDNYRASSITLMDPWYENRDLTQVNASDFFRSWTAIFKDKKYTGLAIAIYR